MHHLDTELLQPSQVVPAAPADQIDEPGDLQITELLLQGQAAFGAYEGAGAGDKKMHSKGIKKWE